LLRFGSFFSGAGLLDIGFEQAGIEHAWFCESDPWRREILRNRWPGVPVWPDIRELRAGDLAPVDGIVGGFPCKGVSSAGNRNGFDHPETVLWREMARVVGELRPGYVVLENVANLLTIKKGLVWQEVLETLASLRFDVVWDCIPAAAVGATHLRDRVFAVARRADDSAATTADHGAASDSARLREGRPGPQAGADRERARAGADNVARCGCLWDFIDADGFCACCHAHLDDPRGLYAIQGDGRHRFRDCPAVADADGAFSKRDAGQRRLADWRADAGGGGQAAADAARRSPRRDDEDATRRLATEPHGVAVEWGEYQPAIQRWEAIHGPAPEPLLRRMDDGDAKLRRMRSRVDRSRLSALGDGVHVYVARIVGEYVVWLEQQRRLQLGLDAQKERAHVTHA
jgi:DNA (cytosine-5)-methyltransferase 1